MQIERGDGRIDRRGLLRRSAVGVLGLAGISLAACAQSASTPAAAPAQPTAPAPPPTTASKPAAAPTAVPAAATQAPAQPKALTHVVSSQTASGFEQAYVMIGAEKGLYAEEGVDIEFLDLQDGVAQLKALLSGESLLGMMGTGAVLAAIEKGADLRLIGAPRPKLNMVLYVRNEIGSLEDLYGKSVGVASVGALLHQIMVALMQKHNLDVNQVEWVNIGSSSNVFKAVLAGKVAAGPAPFDLIPLAEQDGSVKVLLSFADELPQYLRSTLVTTRQVIVDQPDLLERVMAGYAKSIRYGVQHEEDIVRLAVEQLGVPEESARFGHKIEVRDRILEPNLAFTEEQVQWMQEVNVQTGEQTQVLPFERMATLELQQRMTARIGRWDYP